MCYYHFMSVILDFTTDPYVKHLLILTKQTQKPLVFFLHLDSACKICKKRKNSWNIFLQIENKNNSELIFNLFLRHYIECFL